eukprot:295145-Ditylum_brightwellii.AAC.1
MEELEEKVTNVYPNAIMGFAGTTSSIYDNAKGNGGEEKDYKDYSLHGNDKEKDGNNDNDDSILGLVMSKWKSESPFCIAVSIL